jgi:SAM-dependent methyltransferase
MLDDERNVQLASSTARVDEINQAFYGRFQFPQPPLAFDAPANASLETLMLNQNLGAWDHSLFPEHSRIWVAGCGTNQAVFVGLRFPSASILATDLSAQSLETSSRTAYEVGLKNVEFRQQSINHADYPKEFDLVICTGVIHHNADPAVPLKQLAEALKPRGTLELMVYNRYHRILTTAFQKAIRRLCRGASFDDELRTARKLAATLRLENLLTQFVRQQAGLSEAEFADNLLQPVEHSYTVESLAALLDSCGLTLITPCLTQWSKASQNVSWSIDFEDTEIAARYDSLSDLERWELYNHLMAERAQLLWFYASRKESCRKAPSERELCEGFLSHRFAPAATQKRVYLRGPDGKYAPSPRSFEYPGVHPDVVCRRIVEAITREPRMLMDEALKSTGISRGFATVNSLRLRLTTSRYPFLISVPNA